MADFFIKLLIYKDFCNFFRRNRTFLVHLSDLLGIITNLFRAIDEKCPIFWRKCPTFCMECPTSWRKCPTFCMECPTSWRKCPTLCIECPTFCIECPTFIGICPTFLPYVRLSPDMSNFPQKCPPPSSALCLCTIL